MPYLNHGFVLFVFLTRVESVMANQQRGFFISVRAGDHKKVKQMVKEKQVDVNAADPEDPRGATAIIIASELGDVEMVRILMKAKPKPADVNAETVTGRRAIWCVCMCVCVYVCVCMCACAIH